MSGPGVGFEYPRQKVSWLQRDLLLFANSIGAKADELHLLYGDTQEVIDFYASSKATKIPGVPEFDYRRVVDGQRKMEFIKPLPTTSAGRNFETRTKVVGVYDKGKPGTVLDVETELVDVDTDDVYTRIHSSSFFIGQGNWDGPKGPATVSFPPPKDRQPDAVVAHQTTAESALLYRLNGDYNPLHATPEPGSKMGFGGAIMHGLYSWNSTCLELPGDRLVTRIWKTGENKGEFEEIRFVTEVEGGKVCLSNGRALLKTRVSYDDALCTVRYIGEVAGATGAWLGVEWDDSTRGKHDGSHKGKRYFQCKYRYMTTAATSASESATAASFVRPTRPSDTPVSFVAALKAKYVEQEPEASEAPYSQVKFAGKIAEEVGFDKVRRQMAQLDELKMAILDGVHMASARQEGEPAVAHVSPKLAHIDISRNLFENLGPVVEICKDLPSLKKLAINGNRFQNVLEDAALGEATTAFLHVSELGIGDNMLRWEEICRIAVAFPSLTNLAAGANQLTQLSAVNCGGLSTTLTSLNLEFNSFSTISDLASLTSLSSLRNIYLKGNNIRSLSSKETPCPTFPASIRYIDISYNQVDNWDFIDNLTKHFPGLTALRISHNPVYDVRASHNAPTATADEAHMFTIARIGQLQSLNFSQITADDRANAEMFYLSRIAKQLAA
ncbi:hypothetical protein LLEC1_06364, partial [Akanthomyces lecanii]